MATAPVNGPLASVETVADLLVRLGNIPPERIRFHPTPGKATERDVIAARASPERRLCELIDGVLVEKAVMGTKEALLASLIGYYIWTYLDVHDLGFVLGADGMIRLWPGRIRIPDAAFFSWDTVPDGELPDEAVASIVPDLAIEVLSKNNTRPEIAQKLADLFRAGTKLAWVIDPKTRSADVYSSPDNCGHVGPNGKLLGEDVLPGFQLSLAKLFARAKRGKRKS